MLIRGEIVKNTYTFIISEVVFPFRFKYLKKNLIMFSNVCPFCNKIHMKLSFRGNQIGEILAILLLKMVF